MVIRSEIPIVGGAGFASLIEHTVYKSNRLIEHHENSILNNLLAQQTVHTGMAGKTVHLVGSINDMFNRVLIKLLTSRKKSMDAQGFNLQDFYSIFVQPARIE